MSGLNIIWIGLGVSGGVFFSYILVPKGQNQTTTRTCLILSLVCCYLIYDDSNYVHENNSDNEDLGTEIQDIGSTV
ncbi:12595_t:CDS:2 [Entrophospora sp. SA101]|nr:12595_t:CDS:2 [Entrophospora sp. SA101]